MAANRKSISIRYPRPVLHAPDGSVARPIFNEANLLEQITVNLHGAAIDTPFVTNIDYNAKGQRTLIQYGNGTQCLYNYDPETYRMVELKTTRASDKATLQCLTYSYDPVGNITSISDAAQQSAYFNNQVVKANAYYTCDALYRLTSASGREHIGQNSQPETTWKDTPRGNQPLPTDGQAVRNYVENYSYDGVGNILYIVHQATNGNWTRTYAYDEPNASPANNRLTSTAAGSLKEPYAYDHHGNMTRMPHLPQMAWDFKDQLASTQRQVVNRAPGEKTYYVYDAAGQRVRKITQSGGGTKIKERIYLGGYEIYREYASGDSTITLERQTLHLKDSRRTVALVETNTTTAAAPIVRYQFDNHLGSASLELDASAAVISYEEYFPYGSTSYQAVSRDTEVSPKRYRYTGKERDEETGLYYYGARYYASWLGRWTSADPSGLRDGTNLYWYARSRPITLVDPSGLDSRTASDELVNPKLVKRGHYTGKESQARIHEEYAALGKPFKGNARWDEAHQTWWVDRKQLIRPSPDKGAGNAAPAGPSPTGPAPAPIPAPHPAQPAPTGSGTQSQSKAATAGEAVKAFAGGALKGAAIGLGLIALGSLGTVIGVGLLAYGAYKLATGGYKDVAASASRLASGKGTASDYEALGGIVGGVAAGGVAGMGKGGAAGVEGGTARIEGGTAGVEGGVAGAEGAEGAATGAAADAQGARFIVDENGNVVDTHSTPPGSYDQPGGGRTDILQREDHGAGLSHTHDSILNTNPRTGQTFMNGLQQPGRPVSLQDVQNITSGAAMRSAPKGR